MPHMCVRIQFEWCSTFIAGMYLIRYSVCDTIRVRRNFFDRKPPERGRSISPNANLECDDDNDNDFYELKMIAQRRRRRRRRKNSSRIRICGATETDVTARTQIHVQRTTYIHTRMYVCGLWNRSHTRISNHYHITIPLIASK